MSATNVLQLFRSNSSRCLCLLPPRLLAVTPTQTLTPTTRLLSTQPNTKRERQPQKKKRRSKQEIHDSRGPVNTKLSDVSIVESRHAYGGGSKQKAITMATSYFELASQQGAGDECRIVDVVHGDPYTFGVNRDRELVAEKVMRYGYTIEVEATPLLGKFTADSLLEGVDVSDVSEDVLRRFHESVGAGHAWARITSRPGQVGNCNGKVCEGKLLSAVLKGLTKEEEDLRRLTELEALEAEG